MPKARRSSGDGSIFYDKAKRRYVGVLVTGWRDGKPVRKKVMATSRAGAAARLRELRTQASAGELPQGKPPTVEEWLTYWLDNIAARKNRPSTMAGYRSNVNQHIIPLLGHHRIDRLTPEHVEQAWDELIEVGNPSKDSPTPLSPTTALQTHRILSRALKVAMQREKVRRNVCTLIDAPSIAETDIHPMSLEEARRVLAFCKDPDNGMRNVARWSVALSLGLRQGEALGLSWPDVDLDEGVIHVRRALGRVAGQGLVLGPVKSKASNRRLRLPAELLPQMRAHRAQQARERLEAGSWWNEHDLVFTQLDGKPIDPKQDWKTWHALLADAGVGHYRLHDARHTAATLLLLQKVDRRVVMEILGHSQISVTMRYQHVVDEMQREAADRMNAALWGEPSGS